MRNPLNTPERRISSRFQWRTLRDAGARVRVSDVESRWLVPRDMNMLEKRRKEGKQVSTRYEHLTVCLHVVNKPPANSLPNFFSDIIKIATSLEITEEMLDQLGANIVKWHADYEKYVCLFYFLSTYTFNQAILSIRNWPHLHLSTYTACAYPPSHRHPPCWPAITNMGVCY